MALHQLKYPYRKFLLPMVKKISWISTDAFAQITVLRRVSGIYKEDKELEKE